MACYKRKTLHLTCLAGCTKLVKILYKTFFRLYTVYMKIKRILCWCLVLGSISEISQYVYCSILKSRKI